MTTASGEVGPLLERLDRLRAFQAEYAIPVTDSAKESPVHALSSLRDAADQAPPEYRAYLDEAVDCYEGGMYRGAILMVWAATVQHMYGVVRGHHGGIKAFEAVNVKRYGKNKNYREIRKVDDFLYLGEAQFLQLAEDSGMINRNARATLITRLNTRNLCGHPTGYTVGREETVVYVESLVLNVLTGSWLNW
ncbi:hypothetical protein [Pedococcus sp. P5_B7]